jgi:ubiquinone/menaquinone biosynthesis C-methylase UbiE
MMITAATLFDRMSALADPVRSRVLLALERHELTVSELCSVFQVPQSTMSRHLKVLGDEGWVVARAEGTSRRYTMPPLDPQTRRLWQLVREQVAALPAADQDAQRVSGVLAQRKTRSQEFFSSAVGEWDRMRAELFGRRTDLMALLGLLDEGWTVGDLGCGTGEITEALAPFAARVIAVDDSAAMLGAARKRLGGLENVEVRAGQVESLPIGDAELDAAILFLVMHFVPDPLLALVEARRVLKPGGRMLVVDMAPHEREEYRARMGHVWLGFSRDQLGGWMEGAGLSGWRYVPLPADPQAKGPGLFAASARKGE